ncbi:MAG: type II toxin-antitoxin system tRNA(fMet)-specific endonuclease VapC [Gammaproteobacteria bacterium]
MVQRYLFDTNICIHIINRRLGFERLLDRVGQHQYGEILISAITLAELRFGVAKSQSRRRAENEKMLELFLARFPVMDFDSKAAAAYGPLRAGLERQGTPIGAMDTLIAAHALRLGTAIVTHNAREFMRVPRLPVENWLDG